MEALPQEARVEAATDRAAYQGPDQEFPDRGFQAREQLTPFSNFLRGELGRLSRW